MANENMLGKDPPDESFNFDSAIKELIYKSKQHPPPSEEIERKFSRIEEFVSTHTANFDSRQIIRLLPIIEKIPVDFTSGLFRIFEILIPKLTDPWDFIEELLSLRSEKFVLGTLELLKCLLSNRIVSQNPGMISFFAGKYDIDNSVWRSENVLSKIKEILDLTLVESAESGSDPLLNVYHEASDRKTRLLAARLLDLRNTLPSTESVSVMFGKEVAAKLSPYLLYTRASYSDLLCLIPSRGKYPPVIDSISDCELICGGDLLKNVIANLGWEFVNFGISVRHIVGVTVAGSLPLFLSESEATLFEKKLNGLRISEYYLFNARGGIPHDTAATGKVESSVAIFRAYNLAHANLLREILDVSPLTVEKINGIIKQMDCIVADFVKLFDRYSEECKILPDVYGNIKNRILVELGSISSSAQLSANVTRLVQMFENPRNMGEVHTLHGLKRYLHQRGLQLGFKLVDQSKSPNESMNIVVASKTKILSVIRKINYADFESEETPESISAGIPYPVKVVVDAFERQTLHGLENFPTVNIFCYGNEVHYFVWFRNHPVFIRIDYSPPLQGGMIDLQYFGVSNYEVSYHPNLSLDAIRTFFQLSEFDVQIDGTHIKARYDKERALDLSQLCERVEYLFRLVPYMMDLDWVIGSLKLGNGSKKKVAKAWAELFMNQGVIPLEKILTKDKRGILKEVLHPPEGEREMPWDGEGEYKDLITTELPSDYFKMLISSFEEMGLSPPKFRKEKFFRLGQLELEKEMLNYLRESLKCGEIKEGLEGYEKVISELFQRIHEAVCFARIINRGGEELKLSIALAQILRSQEQTLRFQTTGAVESFRVESSVLPLRGDSLKLYALRDHQNIIRLAFYTRENFPYLKREAKDELWKSNLKFSPVEFISLLRRNNYISGDPKPKSEISKADIQNILDDLLLFREEIPDYGDTGEKKITGLGAAPGRVTGRVTLGIRGRNPEDFVDRILIASTISPDENTFIFNSAGVIATGGGILSHAGLIATQFKKPALIISGRWKQENDGTSYLLYTAPRYRIENKKVEALNVTIYFDIEEREYRLREGDLVILDATNGNLTVLGRERDTIALFEELRTLGRTNEKLSDIHEAEISLITRGRKLKIRHHIEKLLNRLSDKNLAGYTLQEILIGKFLEGRRSTPDEKAYLINLVLTNKEIGKASEHYLFQIIKETLNRYLNLYTNAEKTIPHARHPFEAVLPRLEVVKTFDLIKNIFDTLGSKIPDKIKDELKDVSEINSICIERLQGIKKNIAAKINELVDSTGKREFLRHLTRQSERIDLLLKTEGEGLEQINKVRADLESNDANILTGLREKYILKSGEVGFGSFSLVGWKAANLAELERLGCEDLVPPWFVITDKAFQRMLGTAMNENIVIAGETISRDTTLKEAIDDILLRIDMGNGEKSNHIRNLWESITINGELREFIIEAYGELENKVSDDLREDEKECGLFVAVRSSSCEEDAEVAAGAGEFETYLFISGIDDLIKHIKRTWSGLWTERAIHNRTALGDSLAHTTGGIIVQRIVRSRVAGVLQTINVARSHLKQMVINAGLGLGEGIVSGAVAADQIIVSKEGDLENDPLHFNYITADKLEQIVFNKRVGRGTILSSTLYHQRFRPALEYIELCELVAVASRLEKAYGYPLDIEYGIEGSKLWILQVRPVAVFLPAFRETIEKYPLVKRTENTKEKIK